MNSMYLATIYHPHPTLHPMQVDLLSIVRLSLRATNGSAAISAYLHCEIAEPVLSRVEGVAPLPRNDAGGLSKQYLMRLRHAHGHESPPMSPRPQRGEKVRLRGDFLTNDERLSER